MKALVYNGPKDIKFQNFADPALESGDSVILKVKKSSICGSDLHIYHGDLKPDRPFVVGHEFIGEVVEVGDMVRRFKVGDDVIAAPGCGCGVCRSCHAGGGCENGVVRVFGMGPLSNYLHGGQAEYVMVPAADTSLIKIPEGVNDDQAILLTDNLPTGYAGAKWAEIQPGQTVAVIGLGSVGLNAVECAYFLGASKVFAVDKIPERLAAAESMGAIPISGEDAVSQIREATKGVGVDSFIEAVGYDATIRMGFDLVRPGGVISVVGASQNPDFSFPMASAFWNGLRFHIGLSPVRSYWDELILLIQSGRLKPERVVTHHMALSEGGTAYEIFDARKDGAIKIVLDSKK